MSSAGKKTYTLHKWCGLLAGLFIFIMGISGAILVFHNELDAADHSEVWKISNSSPVSLDNAYQTVTRKYNNWDIRLQRFSDDPTETLVFNLRRPEQRLTVFVHPTTGVVLKEINTEKTVVHWILKLHYTLHAKLLGEILVLFFGICYLISLITGLVIYRRALWDMFLFRIKFKNKKKRSVVSSLHRYVGVWALFLNLFIVSSGLVISYEVIKSGIKPKTAPTPISYPIRFSLDQTLVAVKAKYPDFGPTYIRFPVSAESPLTINGNSKSQAFFYSQYYTGVAVNAQTGKIADLKLASTAPASIQLSSIVRGIHFVEFGNLPIKLLFFLIGLSAPMLSITGFLLWKWKTRRKY